MSPDVSPKPLLRLYSALILATSIAIPAIVLVRHHLLISETNISSPTSKASGWPVPTISCTVSSTARYSAPSATAAPAIFRSILFSPARYPRFLALWRRQGSRFLQQASVLALIAVYILLRRLNVSVLLSAAAVTSVLAVATTQQALLGAKGDSLAAALNLWGVVLCVGSQTRRALYDFAAFSSPSPSPPNSPPYSVSPP